MNATFHSSQPSVAPIAAAAFPDTPSFRRLAGLTAAVCTAAALAGCGGGGGGGGESGGSAAPLAPAPAPTPVPGPLNSDHYLVAGVVGSDTAGHQVVVADTDATRSAAMLSVPVLNSLPMLSTAAYAIDTATSLVTYRGSPLTFFINGGQLWQIDLSPSKPPVSVRVSSMTDGCVAQMVAPLDANGIDAWVLVETAGADGNCATAADNRQVFIRSGASTSTAPTVVPAQTRVEPVYLTGADGALWWMLGVDRAGATSRVVAYGPGLDVVGVAGGDGIQVLSIQGHAAKAAEGTYVRADNTLRRIEATASALSIGSSQLAFTGASSVVLLEGSAMYFSNGDTVYKVDGAAPAALLSRPNAGAGSTALLAKTSSALVLTQPDGSGGNVVWAVDKTGGSARSLLRQEEGRNEVWAVHGEQVFYFAPRPGSVGELRSIKVDGSGDARAVSNLLMVGRILNRAWVRGERTEIGSTSALLACQPLPGNADCRGSTLLQIDLPTLAVTALGNFPNTATAVWQARGGAAFDGLKGGLIEVHSNSAAAAPKLVDLYVFNPGQANSLKHVSPATP